MLRKFNPRYLLIAFCVLLAIILLSQLFENKNGERNFKRTLTEMDSSAISSILIYPASGNHKEVKLALQDGVWKLVTDKGSYPADTAVVFRLLESVLHLNPDRLAAEDEASWKEFNTDDSSGTRIKVMSGETLSADLVVGKFSYDQTTGNGISYVRVSGEKPVYAVSGWLAMSCNQKAMHWRNKTVLAAKDPAEWQSFQFKFPADSGYTLSKSNGLWTINGQKCDSARAEQFAKSMSRLQGNEFAGKPVNKGTPLYTVLAKSLALNTPAVVQIFPADSLDQYLINSSLNPEAWFSEGKNHIWSRMGRPKAYFLKTN